MKKITAFILTASLVLGFASCGNDNKTTTQNYGSTAQSETTTESLIDTPRVIESTVVDDENLSFQKSKMIITGAADPATLSGFAPLEKVSYNISDPHNSSGLSTVKKSHSHGPASGGTAHHTVVAFQKEFDKYGALTLDTSGEKVLYLTFDCGYEYENLTSKVLDVLKEKGVTATFFCTLDHIKKETDLIARMIKEGHIVGNHSTTHPSFATIDRTKMAKEIEQTENYLREKFGYAAKYFRFPAGEYNESALELVKSLGYMSVFWSVAYDDWATDNVRGKDYAIEKVMSRLHPGAVILLHSVSKDNAAALAEIIDKARAEGYRFESIMNYE
ncbi:MAG: polysaccharide deacetylase family protein [Clostridia bacterium]|nr:polysaccharide deacetylase family protein [Clostridia bacterium]